MAQKENPMEKVLIEIRKIMEQFEAAKGKKFDKDIPKNVEKQLDQLEIFVAAFKESTYKVLQSSGVTEKEIAESLLKAPDKLSTREKRSLENVLKIKKELQDYKTQTEMKLQHDKKKQKKKGRKKKFKRLGGKDGWQPI